MTRLYRPYIPVEIKCRVVLRQLGEMFPDEVVIPNSRRLGSLLRDLLFRLSDLLGCEIGELRLDHDPPLALRQQFKNGRGEIVRYVPAANDPNHLRYRPHGAQHKGSHDIKTRVRGDHGQFSDLALIRRAKRREKKLKKKRRVWRRATGVVKPAFASGKMKDAPSRIYYRKRKWPKRSFPKRNKQ